MKPEPTRAMRATARLFQQINRRQQNRTNKKKCLKSRAAIRAKHNYHAPVGPVTNDEVKFPLGGYIKLCRPPPILTPSHRPSPSVPVRIGSAALHVLVFRVSWLWMAIVVGEGEDDGATLFVLQHYNCYLQEIQTGREWCGHW